MDVNVTSIFVSIFKIAWAILDINIPIGAGMYITPWAVILFSIFLGITLKFLFKKGREE